MLHSASAEQTLQQSRFIAAAAYAGDESSVAKFLRAMAAQHSKASHLAYAYRVQTEQGIVQRFSDAGEPSGTAGKPILQLLEGRQLINTVVGVIRYYGGINLGTGGLARAYAGTARMAIEQAQVVDYVAMQTLRLQLPLHQFDYLQKLLSKYQGQLLSKQFSEVVDVVVELPAHSVANMMQQLGL